MNGHWLFVAARVFVRDVRDELALEGRVGWSAPRDVQVGDLALLYEMGKPDNGGDPLGRKQIGWVLRALTVAEPDKKRNRRWDYTADFEGAPLMRPVPLSDARRAFDSWRGGSLQGIRHALLPDEVWEGLLELINERNEGFAAMLSDAPDTLFDELPEGAGADDVEFPVGIGRTWRRERWLQDDVSELIAAEGWAYPPDSGEARFGRPSLQGYYLPNARWFADDLLLLGERHLVVVEYELQALGDRLHGVAQAADYRGELRRRLRGWQVDAVGHRRGLLALGARPRRPQRRRVHARHARASAAARLDGRWPKRSRLCGA